MDIKNEKELAEYITDCLNSSVFNTKAFCKCMTREHRYLQSEFTNLCLQWIETCAADDYGCDGRNEWCHDVAKKIVELKAF